MTLAGLGLSLNAMFAALTASVPTRCRCACAAGYYATAAAVVVLAVPYVLGSRDLALPRALRPDFS